MPTQPPSPRLPVRAFRCAASAAVALATVSAIDSFAADAPGAVGALGAANLGAVNARRPFPHPDRIRYDGHCMTIDGKDLVIYSGAFHYFRCPRELWADRFARIKEGGFNAVETYVAWNVHEREMPAALDDFSKVDLRDVEDWLAMAEANGLYVIIRPGPYICAEWDRGGFPGWLALKKPPEPKTTPWFRGDDPVFVAWSNHWFDAVCPALAPHQITRKKPGEPGIILFQLENEYDYSGLPEAVKMAYVKDLAREAAAKGIDVPMFTCWTHGIQGNPDPVLRGVFDSCNFYPGWGVDGTAKNTQSLRENQPDAPQMTTELQGGWFTGAQGGPELRPDAYNWRPDLVPSQINNLTLFVWQNGETITNYYMLFGGTNLADTAAHGIATSYDYSCPIRENGGVDEKYLRVKALGGMIREHGPRLARAEAVAAEATTAQKDVTVVERRAADGGRYLFVRTNQHAEPRSGEAEVKESGGGAVIKFTYDLEPFGAKVLCLPPGVTDAAKGEWLPKSAAPIERPTDLPAAVAVSESRSIADPGPSEFKPLVAGESLNAAGIYDSRFVYYKLALKATDQDLADPAGVVLKVRHDPSDHVIASVNGARLDPKNDGGAFPVRSALHSGDNDVVLLYENTGYGNGGAAMEKLAGVTRVGLAPGGAPQAALRGWRLRVLDKGEKAAPAAEAAAALKDADLKEPDWPETKVEKVEADQLHENQSAVFRTTVDLTRKDIDARRTTLNVSRMDDRGTVFVNGKKVGQGNDWSQEYEFAAARQLRAGVNVVTIAVENKEGAGGLGVVTLTASDAGANADGPALVYSDQPAGVAGQWWKPDLDDSAWKQQSLPEPAADPAALLTWRRLSFALPDARPGVWVPWLARLDAAGNGFIYLNGHNIGRFWGKSGQRDYYLPECWLNTGRKPNVLTLCLRPTADGASVKSAVVMPYAAYAEKR